MNALKQGLALGARKVHFLEVIMHFNHLGEHDVSWFFWTFPQRSEKKTFEFQENLVKILIWRSRSNDLSASPTDLSTEADWKWHCAPHAGLIRWKSDVMSRTVFCFRIEKSDPLTEDFRKNLDVERWSFHPEFHNYQIGLTGREFLDGLKVTEKMLPLEDSSAQRAWLQPGNNKSDGWATCFEDLINCQLVSNINIIIIIIIIIIISITCLISILWQKVSQKTLLKLVKLGVFLFMFLLGNIIRLVRL